MLQAPQCKQRRAHQDVDAAERPTRCDGRRVRQIQEAFNCSGGCVREVYAKEYEKWLKEETNGGKAGASS